MSLESFTKTLHVNTIGTFNVCRLVASHLSTQVPSNPDGTPLSNEDHMSLPPSNLPAHPSSDRRTWSLDQRGFRRLSGWSGGSSRLLCLQR